MALPNEVNVLGIRYSITYVDNPAEVDRDRRKSLWGQIDFWTRAIRIYANKRPAQDVWQTILHEVLHAIVSDLHLDKFEGQDDDDTVDVLALALMDVFIRNDWLKQSD